MAFVRKLRNAFDLPASEFPTGPFPADKLTYKSARAVMYRTPAQADGLGTMSWIKKNGSPIDGVAMLVGDAPDLVHVVVRLPDSLRWLAPSIIGQVARR